MNRYLEIDFDKLNTNLKNIKEYAKNKHIMAIVKGNAYGLGMLEIAHELEGKVEYLGVGLEYEAIKLRKNNIKTPILILSPYFKVDNIIKYNISPAIDNLQSLKILNEEAKKQDLKISFHLKVNTGMNRFGISPSEIDEFIKEYKAMDNVILEGVFSHFAITKDRNKKFVESQINTFNKMVNIINDNNIEVKYIHMENSKALFSINSNDFNMARIGSGLYGKIQTSKVNLKEVSALKAKIIDVRSIEKNQFVGYGLGYKTKSKINVAIIPIGFSDGYEVIREQKSYSFKELFLNIAKLIFRYKRDRSLIYYNGTALRTIGKPNMQFVLIDITKLNNIALGDIVEVKVPAFFVSDDLPRVFKNSTNSEIEVSI